MTVARASETATTLGFDRQPESLSALDRVSISHLFQDALALSAWKQT